MDAAQTIANISRALAARFQNLELFMYEVVNQADAAIAIAARACLGQREAVSELEAANSWINHEIAENMQLRERLDALEIARVQAERESDALRARLHAAAVQSSYRERDEKRRVRRTLSARSVHASRSQSSSLPRDRDA